jgi:hypothetical protein
VWFLPLVDRNHTVGYRLSEFIVIYVFIVLQVLRVRRHAASR